MTIQDLIDKLHGLAIKSQLGYGTVVVLCEDYREYAEIKGAELEQEKISESEYGALVLLKVGEDWG